MWKQNRLKNQKKIKFTKYSKKRIKSIEK